MADAAFNNLNSFINNGYKQSIYDPAKKYAGAEESMEKRLVEQAEKAVHEGFDSISLSEKMAELGYGERFLQQIGNTVKSMAMQIVNPILDYLKRAETVTDQEAYQDDMQRCLRQTYNVGLFMAAQDNETNKAGRKFVWNI